MGWFFSLLNAIWEIAAAVSKYILLLIFLGGVAFYFKKKKKQFNLERMLQYSIKKILTQIGPIFVVVLLLSGLLNFFVNNIWISLIPLVLCAPFFYIILKKGITTPEKLKITGSIFFYVFSALFLVCLVASLILNTPLLNSIMSLFLLGILFWEL